MVKAGATQYEVEHGLLNVSSAPPKREFFVSAAGARDVSRSVDWCWRVGAMGQIQQQAGPKEVVLQIKSKRTGLYKCISNLCQQLYLHQKSAHHNSHTGSVFLHWKASLKSLELAIVPKILAHLGA